MTIVKRLRLLTAVLGAATASAVVGTAVLGDIRAGRASRPDAAAIARTDAPSAEDFGKTRFTTLPALTYKSPAGPTVFAWQVKPALTAAPARDRDILVLVDTSASQGGEPLRRARHIIDGLAKAARPGDRINVWTVNISDPSVTRSLTDGPQPAGSDAVRSAAARLIETEFAAGATDLKAGIEAALKSFDGGDPARNRVVLFLGDGESAASTAPVTEAVRVELGSRMGQKGAAFFAVPLGIKVNAYNLHGLATLTGGTVVRLTDDVSTGTGRAEFAGKLTAAFDVPVLKPTKAEFGPEVAVAFPSKLPPLRADRPTLVVGTLKADAPSVTARIEGTVAGVPTRVELAERLPASEADNYFLHAMLEQWRTAPDPGVPATLAADRALALASQQFGLFREEFLTQAVYAVSGDKLDHAGKLYEAARKIDPTSPEADAGLKVVAKLRAGQLTRDQLRAGLGTKPARANLERLSQQPDQPPAGGAKPATPQAAPTAGPTPLQQAQAERTIQEQQYRVLVDETIRRARQLLATDPDSAYEDLKRQRDAVLANAALGDVVRGRLAADLEAAMQTIATKGAEIKRRAAEERARVAATRLRINEYERQQSLDEQTRARIGAFSQLMNQARYELAQAEAELLIIERVDRGYRFTPLPEVIAAYRMGQTAANLREHRSLIRIREDRFLLTMMQAEKSYIPYPDEPPVHFPPAAVWRELTADRQRYGSYSLGADVSPNQARIQSIIDGPNAQRLKISQELDGMELKDFLGYLEKDHGLQFVVLEDEFRTEGEAAILAKKLQVKQKLTGLTVGTALDIALQSVGATYVVRPEYIEVTTFTKRLKEKVVRAFDVTELVYQIPSSVNQAVLRQNQQVQATNLALFGQATFAGGFGAIGGLGLGGFGALGGLGAGALGAGGGIAGGGLGAGGGIAGGVQGGFGGGFGGGGAGNLGAGGGVAGIGGGQLGQFGNLGGQFGIQGNSLVNYQLIAMLIHEVVARGEWSDLPGQFRVTTPQPGQQQSDENVKLLPEDQLNSLAYYPPTRALIVRATGKYHPASSVKLKRPEGGAMAPNGNPAKAGDRVAAAPPAANAGNVGNAVALADKPKLVNPKEDLREMLKGIDRKDPLRMWQQAMDQSNVTDPGLVVACADFLFEHREPGHAAEILKAGIRRGVANEAWAHDALAIALKEGKAAPADIERAGLSAIDLDPADPQAYMKAAKVEDESGRTDAALAYCRRAAELEPNLPVAYANALVYAERSGRVHADAVLWATDNLLRRDWANDAVDYHAETTARLARIVDKFERAGQPAQVERFKKVLANDKQRDLVIELLWQGTADLDLHVTEPSGSTATPMHPRTAGGGVLKADILEQGNDRSEVYTAAEAFAGKYAVAVKAALGRPIGNRAQVKVTKFKGTDKEAVELYTIDLADPKPVQVSLAGGSRTELVDVTLERTDVPPVPVGPAFEEKASGLTANPYQQTTTTPRPAGPLVVQPHETRLAGVTPSAPGMRAVMDLTPDRKNVRIKANPVFGGPATDLPLPRVSLLPGGDGR